MVCLNDKVYVGGGGLSFDAIDSARLYIYCPITDTWDTMDTPVYDFALTVYRSQIVLLGGRMYHNSENVDGRPNYNVWTLKENGWWPTTLPPMETTCLNASAVSHGDHVFVIDNQRVYVCNGHNWAIAQHPTFCPTIMPHISSTVINGCWYVLSGGEVHYTSLDLLLAGCQPSYTPQSSSVWKRLRAVTEGSCCLAKCGNRLVAIGWSTVYAFSQITQSWVDVGDVPFRYTIHCFPCAEGLPLIIMARSRAYNFTVKG